MLEDWVVGPGRVRECPFRREIIVWFSWKALRRPPCYGRRRLSACSSEIATGSGETLISRASGTFTEAVHGRGSPQMQRGACGRPRLDATDRLR
jgi:hypothetical protein